MPVESFLGGSPGQAGTIALAAQVKLNQMLKPARLGPAENRPHQGRRLGVRQVAGVAQHPRNQVRRSPTGQFQAHVMVELKRQRVHIREGFGQGLIPRPQVGGITEHAGLSKEVRRTFKTKPTGRSAVVGDRHGPAPQAPAERQFFMRHVDVNETGSSEIGKGRTCIPQLPAMLRMTIKRDAAAKEMRETPLIPVVAVYVGKEDGIQALPGRGHGGQSLRQLPRPQANINEHAKAARLDKTGIPRAAAGQDRKMHLAIVHFRCRRASPIV